MKKLITIFSFFCSILYSGSLLAVSLTMNSMPDLDTAKTGNESVLHYNIGGHLFAGAYPINNPLNTGDTGVVCLYRVINNYIIPVDTTRVTTLGYFVFSNIAEGEYLVKASLISGSLHYKDFFPTYLTNSLKWNSSDHLVLNDTNRYEVNIHLVQTANYLSGTGSMAGYVMQSANEIGSKKMKMAEVVLFNSDMSPLTYSFSDNYGNFSFTGLSYGTYYLMAESTGKFPAVLRVTLDEKHPVFDNLMLEVLSHAPMGVLELNAISGIETIPVYPNPAGEKINLVLRSGEPELMIIEIFSLTGHMVYSNKCQVNGYKSCTIPLDQLSKGMYNLVIRSEDNHWSQVQKFLKF